MPVIDCVARPAHAGISIETSPYTHADSYDWKFCNGPMVRKGPATADVALYPRQRAGHLL